MKNVAYSFTVTMTFSGEKEFSDEDFAKVEEWLEEEGDEVPYWVRAENGGLECHPLYDIFMNLVTNDPTECGDIEDIEFEEIECDDEE